MSEQKVRNVYTIACMDHCFMVVCRETMIKTTIVDIKDTVKQWFLLRRRILEHIWGSRK